MAGLKSRLLLALWDPDRRTLLGAETRRWRVRGLYYLAFHTTLAIFFTFCMMGLLATIDEHHPRYTLDHSLIGSSPGIGYRPRPENELSSLIAFALDNATHVAHWTARIDAFLRPYTERPSCEYGACAPLLAELGPCSPGANYSYESATPCVFVKLNKIIGFEPQWFESDEDLPAEMPEVLAQHVRAQSVAAREHVWIACEGARALDRETVGPLSYHPAPGWPVHQLRYDNQPGYLSPLVAVRFLSPARNMVIGVHCTAWAKNILRSPSLKELVGSVFFQLLVDDLPPAAATLS